MWRATIALMAFMSAAEAQELGSFEPYEGPFPLSNTQVMEIQRLLVRLGYDVGAQDGQASRKTASAVKALSVVLETEFVRRPSGHEIVLNCEIEEGAPAESVQIVVDEYRGIVIYGSNNPRPIFKGSQGLIDNSLKISMSYEGIIVAVGSSSSISITKNDGKFVNSFVTPIPLGKGKWVNFGNTVSGKCARNPFDQ